MYFDWKRLPIMIALWREWLFQDQAETDDFLFEHFRLPMTVLSSGLEAVPHWSNTPPAHPVCNSAFGAHFIGSWGKQVDTEQPAISQLATSHSNVMVKTQSHRMISCLFVFLLGVPENALPSWLITPLTGPQTPLDYSYNQTHARTLLSKAPSARQSDAEWAWTQQVAKCSKYRRRYRKPLLIFIPTPCIFYFLIFPHLLQDCRIIMAYCVLHYLLTALLLNYLLYPL